MRKSVLFLIVITVAILFSFSCDKKNPTENNSTPTIPDTVTDIDGNTYKVIQIGDQLWMAENLKVTHYRDGTAIPNVMENTQWTSLLTGAYCDQNNDSSNVSTYGRLYNWYAVNDSRNIAPEGWHVPTDEEFKTLEKYLGMSQSEADSYSWPRGTDEGGKLKETSTAHWKSPNTGATNESGFSALPGNYRSGENGYFNEIGSGADFWTATSNSGIVDPSGNRLSAWSRYLLYNDPYMSRHRYRTKRYGLSLRLVRDSEDSTPSQNKADLINLTISSGSLDPPFSSSITNYTATVENHISNITVTPTAYDSDASIKVNNIPCISGHQSQEINLDEGSNIVTIEVTGADNTMNNYYVNIIRTVDSVHNSRYALISVTDGSDVNWHVQFSQNIPGLQIGVTYTISFTAYANRDVRIYCDVNQGGGSWLPVLSESGKSPFFYITTTNQAFSKSVVSTIKDEGDGISLFQFNLGNHDAYDIYIDNVSVTADGVEQIVNGDFSSPLTTGWNDLYLEGAAAATVTIIDP
jgi:uncharacterized protein (TIGR02145 family)